LKTKNRQNHAELLLRSSHEDQEQMPGRSDLSLRRLPVSITRIAMFPPMA